jgi:hypothetical protein
VCVCACVRVKCQIFNHSFKFFSLSDFCSGMLIPQFFGTEHLTFFYLLRKAVNAPVGLYVWLHSCWYEQNDDKLPGSQILLQLFLVGNI